MCSAYVRKNRGNIFEYRGTKACISRWLYVILLKFNLQQKSNYVPAKRVFAAATNLKTFTQFEPFIPCGFVLWEVNTFFPFSSESISSGRHFIYRQTDQKMVRLCGCNFKKRKWMKLAFDCVCWNPQLHAVKYRWCKHKKIWCRLGVTARCDRNSNNFVYCFESILASDFDKFPSWININRAWLEQLNLGRNTWICIESSRAHEKSINISVEKYKLFLFLRRSIRSLALIRLSHLCSVNRQISVA